VKHIFSWCLKFFDGILFLMVTQSVSQVLEKKVSASALAKTIAIVNQKGGVGKTTTAINLASAISQQGKRVLLVDLDPQANATSGVGLKPEEVDHNLYHLFVDKDLQDKVLYPSPFDNLHVIPASRDLAAIEIELAGVVSRETYLRERLSHYKRFYDYIILDCPPSLGVLTINGLVAADRAIIPLQCEYYAMEGVAGLVRTLTQIKEHLNEELEIAGIVLTMFDQRTTLNKQVVENTREFFKGLVFDTIIPRNIRLTEAPSHGIPISLYQPYSKGAIAYDYLAKEVLNRV
jgi:chromosome partitioning protein